MQLPTCQGRIVSLWVQAISACPKWEKRESASIQYANHREEEPRCAAAEGTCCIYSPLILHWPPHTVRWAPAITTSVRNHPVRDDLEWNHRISGSPAASLHLVISTLNKKKKTAGSRWCIAQHRLHICCEKGLFCFFPPQSQWRCDAQMSSYSPLMIHFVLLLSSWKE